MILHSECMVSTVSISESNKENKTDVITNSFSAGTYCTKVCRCPIRHADLNLSPTTASESYSNSSTRPSEDNKLLSGFVFTTCIKFKTQRKLNKHIKGIF